jgi:hypothetical protein
MTTTMITPPPAGPYRPPSVYGRRLRPYRPPSMFIDEGVQISSIRRINFDEYCEKNIELLNKFNNTRLNLLPCDDDKCECSICMSDDTHPSLMKGKLSCGHIFHEHCIKQWFSHSKNTCPYCRCVIDVNSLVQ